MYIQVNTFIYIYNVHYTYNHIHVCYMYVPLPTGDCPTVLQSFVRPINIARKYGPWKSYSLAVTQRMAQV